MFLCLINLNHETYNIKSSQVKLSFIVIIEILNNKLWKSLNKSFFVL